MDWRAKVEQIRREYEFGLCLFTVTFTSVLKLFIFLYAFAAGVSVVEVITDISKLFGVQLMTLDVLEDLGRVQFNSDSLVPMCIFAVLCLRKRLQIGTLPPWPWSPCFVVSALCTFSRFIWVDAVAGIMLGLLVAKKDRMHLIYIGLTAAAVVYYFDALSAIVILRFSDAQAGSSVSVWSSFQLPTS